jgi:hypothetical protein
MESGQPGGNGDAETRGRGDTGTRRRGDAEIRRRGERGKGEEVKRRGGQAPAYNSKIGFAVWCAVSL